MRHIHALLSDGTLASKYAGLIKIVEGEDGLVLLNYTDACQHRRAWDEVTIACRGLILDRATGEVVARPFPKFFNWGELDGPLPPEAFSVTEKVDGSMGILYRRRGAPALATRGSFTSPEAVRGTRMLQALPGIAQVPDALTLLFEIVLRDVGSTVVRYDFDGLVLLGGVDRNTGHELSDAECDAWSAKLGCRSPKRYSFASLDEVFATKAILPATLEGYVIRFASGLRVKLKSDAYLAVLQADLGVTPGKIFGALKQGEAAYRQLLEALPEELRPEAERVAAELTGAAKALEAEARKYFEAAASEPDRKAFAGRVQKEVPPHLRKALFMLRDRREPQWLEIAFERMS